MAPTPLEPLDNKLKHDLNFKGTLICFSSRLVQIIKTKCYVHKTLVLAMHNHADNRMCSTVKTTTVYRPQTLFVMCNDRLDRFINHANIMAGFYFLMSNKKNV